MNYSTEIDPYLKTICFPSFEGAHCGCILSNEYLDYYNSRIRAKPKGLAACNSQTTSPFGCLL